MRIIAGTYRGKKLKEFSLSTTKPTLDRVKESLFSSIQFNIMGAKVLDLFAGTGALGIEALSRGADNVEFVDNNNDAISLINQNLKEIKGNYMVTNSDYMPYLQKCVQRNVKFDIVLLDPPFNSDFGIKAIQFIIANNLLNEEGIIIYEKAYDTQFCNNFEGYKISEKKYGTIGVVKIVKG